MRRIKRFEEIRAWQEARLLAREIHALIHQSNCFKHDYGLNNQISRAADSIMHNIAEGFDAGSNIEFMRFLRYARRSASKVQSQLNHALDLQDISQQQFDRTYQLAERINAFISYLRKTNTTN